MSRPGKVMALAHRPLSERYWIRQSGKRIVKYTFTKVFRRAAFRGTVDLLAEAVKRRGSLSLIQRFVTALFWVQHYDAIEDILDDRLVRIDQADLTLDLVLTRLYIRLFQETARYQSGIDLADMAQAQGVIVEGDEHLAICLALVSRHEEAVARFRSIKTGELSRRGHEIFIRSIFERGDFPELLAEASKLRTAVGYEFRAYANIYFENWEEAERDLVELARLSPAAYRPHTNLAARDPHAYLPTHIDRVLAPEALVFDNANFLSERLTHIGRGAESLRLYQAVLRTQHRMKRQEKRLSIALTFRKAQLDPADLRLFGPEWTAQIGHIGMIDLALKMRELGWWSGRPLFLVRPKQIANNLFFRLLSDGCPVISDDKDVGLWSNMRSLQRLSAFSFNVFEDKDGTVRSWNESGALLARAWRGASPLQSSFDAWFSKSEWFQDRVFQMKQDLGILNQGWHVCLHVRDDGFYNDEGQSHRNASLETYLQIVKLVHSRGGIVIRMGAPTAPPAPRIAGLVDYARSRWKSEEMDLYFMRTARCFVGAVSGLSNLAVSFDLPSAFVNSISYDAQMWHAKARFVPKTVRTRQGRALSQRELSSNQWRWHLFSADTMKNAGLSSQDNTPDEIRDIVLEVLDNPDDIGTPSKTDLMRRWESSLIVPHYYGGARPGASYLEKHEDSFLLR